jgi:peroxiredoxin
MPRISLNQQAPDFSLPDFAGNGFLLSALRKKKHVLLVFNRTFG